MLRSVKASPSSKAVTQYVRKPKPIRFCEVAGCGKELVLSQRRFCSKVCRSITVGKEGGRPAVYPYKPAYASTELEKYLKWCDEKNERTLLPTKGGYVVLNNAELPSQKGYAKYLKLHTIAPFDEWAVAHIEFAHALDRLKNEQELALINYGLAGRYHPVYGKIILGVNHGMIERRQVDNTHKLIGVVKHVYAMADELDKKGHA